MEVKSYILNPTIEDLEQFRRKELFAIIKSLEIEVKATSTNKILKERIILYYINEGIFEEKYLSLITPDVELEQAEYLLRVRELELKENESREQIRLREI